MIKIEDKSKCTGCTACYNICPQKCICMFDDEEGFKYPKVFEDKCINCNLCNKVCPVINNEPLNKINEAYAVKSKDKYVQLSSSSGGAFYHIAKYYLNKGKVFAAAFDDDNVLIHSEIEDEKTLPKYMGSKYVQSDLKDCFSCIKELLTNEKEVLFVGSPCQVAGLKNYLRKEYSNLLTIDFICHGVPSPLVLKKYIDFFEQTNNSTVTDISFRNKKFGWENFSMKISFDSGEEVISNKNEDVYLKCFFDNVFLRPSCYECNFKSMEKHSDITLSDFWGCKKIDESIYDSDGVSVLMVNSINGQKAFNECKEEFTVDRITVDDVKNTNSALLYSVNSSNMRKIFFRRINNMPIVKNLSDCLNPSIKTRIELRLFNR